MGKTVRGEKGPGYDYWSRRLGNNGCQGYGPEVKKITHRKERMENKRVIENEKKEIE